ncbi:FAD-dependent thymidylate synthase [Thermotoga sp. KOL6]|uniref:FAD-dependent thymidylate synthase n=1 Tax=Thermotoga sp. KOL6 TaxID=126741 RepID=UPI000C76F6F3|nr:FAD-dependent thymidylate synthase [Thermotoga sp. KOL6]PLV59178.1 thymidylate synthase [Thermotoga sp. KOL6]
MKLPVLDKGFVELIDMMGNDLSAVRAARVSFNMELKDEKRDKHLVEYLMKHGHESPFEHIVFTFHVKAPIFVTRQWFRHRIASYNELSGRYSKLSYEFYIPSSKRFEGYDIKVSPEEIVRKISGIVDKAYKMYTELLEEGVPREVARIVLPLNLYTRFYWTVNARSLMNFLNLRADSHAQWEIQQYALAIAKIFEKKCPWTFEAFLKHAYKGDLLREVRT